ncbi:hypothetical protein I1A62_28950 [Rhodococcus sp. USK10]|uniref:Uncharacterized protein n=2 Tax=Nocardiaceae TaxID=85025 RepID=A0A402C7R6_RHOWR|nr:MULTISPECIES: hypothetical protein [Rhodococcus]QYB01277.1 hypothetical protein I1A62_28950 [Rhodococcus sp. USK10]GCE39656.1 hypothetical protein Rhow_003180 [Rhodococcus wratislaviensis]
MTFALAMALLRLEYRLARLPLQLVEDVAVSHLDEQAPSRLAFEQFLIDCDRAAAYLLNDENAARRAADLRRHTTAVGVIIARQQRRAAHETVILLAEQRARFVERRRRRPRGTDPA